MNSYTYLAWLGWFVLLPTAILWSIFWRSLKRYPKTYLWSIFWALVFSVPWDLAATHFNIWFFPPNCCLSPRVDRLPIEEFLFMGFVTFYIQTLAVIVLKYVRKSSDESS